MASTFLLILATAFFSAGVHALYNVTLHPLAHVPGPKLAGMTKMYQTFWAYYAGRSIYYQKVSKMHQQYGSIVRIAPNELSLSDPDDFRTIYSAHSGYSKDPVFYRSMGVSDGMFGAIDSHNHRARRAPWSQTFSKAATSKIYNSIEYRVNLLGEIMHEKMESSGFIPLQTLVHATTMDIVSEYTFPKSFDLLRDATRAEECTSLIFTRARWIWILMANSVLYWLLSGISKLLSKLRIRTTELDRIYMLSEAAADLLDEPGVLRDRLWPKPRPSRLSKSAITNDLYSFNVAGAFNTGTITSVTLFYIFSIPRIRRQLAEELSAVVPDATTPAELERLPYLTACIMEGLRLGYGPIGRLPRLVPPPGATFKGYQVPKGTIVGVWSFVQHHNPEIWGDDHDLFSPERWLDKDRFHNMSKFLMTFGTDGRQCIGKELALAMIRLTIALVMHIGSDLDIHGSFSPEDLDDCFAALVPRGRSRLELCKGCCSKQKT